MNILGAKPYTLKRYSAAGTYNSLGEPVEAAESTSTIQASFQPADARTLQTLEEGFRQRDPRLVLTETALLVDDQDTGVKGDRIVYNGADYVVVSNANFDPTDILPHHEAVAVRAMETA